MVLWQDTLSDVLTKQKQNDEKVPIIDLERGCRIITGAGQVAELTGHKTNSNAQIRILETGQLDWLSCLAKVHLAR